MRTHNAKTLMAFMGTLAIAGCLGGMPSDPAGDAPDNPDAGAATPKEHPLLAQRAVDYGLALRTASLKLVGGLPTMDEIAAVKDAASYSAQIDKYLADRRFSAQMISYFRDMMKMGGSVQVLVTEKVGDKEEKRIVDVSLEAAPMFAAQLVVEDRAMTELFTANAGTCPTYNEKTGTFASANCMTSNGQGSVGVLTDPGAMAHYYAGMAFRRARWVQETFACATFPVEIRATPEPRGKGQYLNAWPFDSISGGSGAPVDFKETTVMCANCHGTMNHLAPLFGNFDIAGRFQNGIRVETPGRPGFTARTDWLPPTEGTAWRWQQPAANLAELGRAMAADPDVPRCQVFRAWNWAMSKTDIVDDRATIPRQTVAPAESRFVTGGYKLKAVLKAIFTHDDFVKFPSALEAVSPGNDPFEALSQTEQTLPSDVASRVHACQKIKYGTLGTMLRQLGVKVQSTEGAGELYSGGAEPLGGPKYLARIREAIELTTSSAVSMFDIWVNAAPEIIDAMPTLPRCTKAGVPVSMFDARGRCTLDGITCLQGSPATEAQKDLCEQVVTEASSPKIGRTIAVAAILSANHTCE